MNAQVEFLVTFFLGIFGVHKFVKGKIGQGILYLCTGGLFGIGWLFDCIKSGISALQLGTPSPSSKSEEIITVAGTSYYLKNIEKLATLNQDYMMSPKVIIKKGKAEKRIFEYYFANSPVELRPEPKNTHDKNAIAVYIAFELVGYISRDENIRIGKLLRSGSVENVTSFISGGRYKVISADGSVQEFENEILVKLYIHYK